LPVFAGSWYNPVVLFTGESDSLSAGFTGESKVCIINPGTEAQRKGRKINKVNKKKGNRHRLPFVVCFTWSTGGQFDSRFFVF
jgi:hypothetical protein